MKILKQYLEKYKNIDSLAQADLVYIFGSYKQILKVILRDVETLNIDLKKDSNKYYYDLVTGNLKDLIKGVVRK